MKLRRKGGEPASAAVVAERTVYGWQPVLRLLRKSPERIRCLILEQNLGRERRGRLPDPLPVGLRVQEWPRERLTELLGTPKHQGVAAQLQAQDNAFLSETDAKELVLSLSAPLLLVLDGVQDPRNFGACLRSADAAGVDLVVIGRSRNVGLTPVVSKVAAGAAEVQPIASVGNLARFLDFLGKSGLMVSGLDDQAPQSLFEVDLTGPTALVVGAEGHGLRRLTRERCDQLVSLPMLGSVESLNVSVAAGICLYESLRQRS